MGRRRFYDVISRFYGIVGMFDNCHKRDALTALGPNVCGRFLDVGCGDGFVLREARRLFPNAIFFGTDFSRGMVSRARGRGHGLSISDCFFLPYGSGSIDVLFSSFVFDLFSSDDERKLMSEFRRVLSFSGRLVLVNNVRGKGVYCIVSGFYVFLSRLFPWLLFNRPSDAPGIVLSGGHFRIVKRKISGFTEILLCEKIK